MRGLRMFKHSTVTYTAIHCYLSYMLWCIDYFILHFVYHTYKALDLHPETNGSRTGHPQRKQSYGQ